MKFTAALIASQYPAVFLGLSRTHGRIAPGFQADLVQLDPQLQLRGTWIAGRHESH